MENIKWGSLYVFLPSFLLSLPPSFLPSFLLFLLPSSLLSFLSLSLYLSLSFIFPLSPLPCLLACFLLFIYHLRLFLIGCDTCLLYRGRQSGTNTENLLSKRVRFAARIVTKNGHDAHRELNGFFFAADNTLTVYEFRQFGTRYEVVRIKD